MRTLLPAALAAATVLVAPAGAQQTQPYAAVTTEATPVRCGDSDRYYAVAQLEPGSLITVVGEARGWAEVVYPGEVGAFITSDDGEVQGDSVIVRRATALRAPAMSSGPSGSWKPLMSRPIDIGVKLELIETVEDSAGREFYRVRPPESARAYVKSTALRRATPTEAEAGGVAAAAGAAAATGNNAKPEPAPKQETPAPQQTAQNDTVPEGTQPEQPEQSNMAAPPREAAPPKPSPLVVRIESLESRFDELRADPSAGPEQFNELIGAFNSLNESLAANPATQGLTARVDQRIAVLELQRDIREQLAVSEAEQAEIAVELDQLRARVERLTADAGFDFVGQVLASGVYDGSRLPLYYRVQSIGETVPRTIGYIRPGSVEGVDLSMYLGRPVGITGNLVKDPVSGLRIIQISKIATIDASLID